MNYFEVVVAIRIETEGAKGAVKVKKVKEVYLVDAMSVTEAEARIVESFTKSGFSQDYEVVAVKASKVVEIIEAEIARTKPKPQIAKEGDVVDNEPKTGTWITVDNANAKTSLTNSDTKETEDKSEYEFGEENF
jgi:hypothetical protein